MAIFTILVFYALLFLSKIVELRMKYICRNCGSIVDHSYTRNSTLGKLAWVFIILISLGIGLIFYIIYKLNNKSLNCCPECKADNSLIPLNTPAAQKILAEYQIEEEEKDYLLSESETRDFKKDISWIILAIIIFLILGAVSSH